MDTGWHVRPFSVGVPAALECIPRHPLKFSIPEIRDSVLANFKFINPGEEGVILVLPVGKDATPPFFGVSGIQVLLVKAFSCCMMKTAISRQSVDIAHPSPNG